MSKASIRKMALKKMTKIALIYSLIIIFVISFVSTFHIKKFKINEINLLINSALNHVSNLEFADNYELLLRKIQRLTYLKELSLYDEYCNLRSSSSISLSFIDCQNPAGDIFEFRGKYGEKIIRVFYKYELSYTALFLESWKALLIIFTCTFLILFLGFLSFFLSSIIMPLNKVQDMLKKNSTLIVPQEFDIIAFKINELREQIAKSEFEKVYFDLARRVVHDIRNPLMFLKLSTLQQSFDRGLFAKKIEEIEYQVSNLLTSSNSENATLLNLEKFFLRVESELSALFSIKLAIHNEIKCPIHLPLNEFDLNNIFSNLVRNSKDAKASAVTILAIENNGFLVFKVQDDGQGIAGDSRSRVFEKNFTSKKDGNGIGLSSLKESILKVNGDISLLDSAIGACFEINLPFKSIMQFIYIDDDKYLRMAWQKRALEKKIILHTFDSVNKFLEVADSFEEETPIYIDSDLGEGQKGETLSEQIYIKGFQNIFLATSLDGLDLNRYPWIKALVNKDPPF